MRESEQAWPNEHLSRWVEAGGIRWHVQQAGRGPVLVLVHGAGASTHSWRDVLPLLARDYAVLAMDLPGHGFTAAVSPAQSSLGGMSALVAELLRVLGVAPEYCVGHSAGAAILCRMALDGCIEPRLIVSINGAFFPFAGAATMFYAPIARLLAGSPFTARMIAWHARNPANVARVIAGTGSTLDAQGIDLYARLVGDPKHVAGVLSMMANWDLSGLERDLPRLRTPLALLAADHDLTVPPAQALRVERLVSDAVVYHLAGLGHLAHEERPLLVSQEIARICRAAA